MSALTRQTLRLTRPTTIRNFSVAARKLAGGDAGAPRSGGAAQGDAFTKREKANEDFYVKEEEKKKLEALRKKIADSEAQLAQDRKDVDQIIGKSKIE
ncbi:related to H+-transporting ATP synthase inhibitor precursor, mitochondrial [Lecanosticta acicola]|uniref:ATPase inhibitor, mitochondrial n=1 Tax=Lecanosticta acicola TaxID=111012 RepID=A0AAI8Z953_9PEZI|nr:related to H+-transporting ATP synthase inhibitor precursor, mitochondrial [Lecanosticta acicola]